MRKIQAIQTEYAGRYFRSRLEARWAVFFDAMEISYEYEMCGLDVCGEWYLPDFALVPDVALVEIKPECIGAKERARVDRIRDALREHGKESGKQLWLVKGNPSFGHYEVYSPFDIVPGSFSVFADCRRCNGSYLLDYDSQWHTPVGHHTCGDNDRLPLPFGERILGAYNEATRHSFDSLARV